MTAGSESAGGLIKNSANLLVWAENLHLQHAPTPPRVMGMLLGWGQHSESHWYRQTLEPDLSCVGLRFSICNMGSVIIFTSEGL